MSQKQEMRERQRRFVEAYLRLGSAEEAARMAGYRPSHGGRVLRSAGVQKLLEARRTEAEEAAREAGRVASAAEVLEYLTGVLRGEADADGRQGASTPRMKAAELLGKRLGIFNEVQEEAALPVIIDDVSRPPGGDA